MGVHIFEYQSVLFYIRYTVNRTASTTIDKNYTNHFIPQSVRISQFEVNGKEMNVTNVAFARYSQRKYIVNKCIRTTNLRSICLKITCEVNWINNFIIQTTRCHKHFMIFNKNRKTKI